MTLADKIAQARQLDAEATPGPWITAGRFVDAPARGQVAEVNYGGGRPDIENARLVTFARNHHAALWAVAEAAAAYEAEVTNPVADYTMRKHRREALFAALRALSEVRP